MLVSVILKNATFAVYMYVFLEDIKSCAFCCFVLCVSRNNSDYFCK